MVTEALPESAQDLLEDLATQPGTELVPDPTDLGVERISVVVSRDTQPHQAADDPFGVGHDSEETTHLLVEEVVVIDDASTGEVVTVDDVKRAAAPRTPGGTLGVRVGTDLAIHILVRAGILLDRVGLPLQVGVVPTAAVDGPDPRPCPLVQAG